MTDIGTRSIQTFTTFEPTLKYWHSRYWQRHRDLVQIRKALWHVCWGSSRIQGRTFLDISSSCSSHSRYAPHYYNTPKLSTDVWCIRLCKKLLLPFTSVPHSLKSYWVVGLHWERIQSQSLSERSPTICIFSSVFHIFRSAKVERVG